MRYVLSILYLMTSHRLLTSVSGWAVFMGCFFLYLFFKHDWASSNIWIQIFLIPCYLGMISVKRPKNTNENKFKRWIEVNSSNQSYSARCALSLETCPQTLTALVCFHIPSVSFVWIELWCDCLFGVVCLCRSEHTNPNWVQAEMTRLK